MADENMPVATVVLRVITVMAYFIAAILMFCSFETVHQDSFRFEARYSDWGSLSFFAIFAVVSLFMNSLIVFIPAGSPLWRTSIIVDVLLNSIAGASIGIAWQTYLIMKSGNCHFGLTPICGTVPYFCQLVAASLGVFSAGLIASWMLLMWTLHESVDPFIRYE